MEITKSLPKVAVKSVDNKIFHYQFSEDIIPD